MPDYNNYTYSKLLNFLQEGYQKYPKYGNYTERLLAMKDVDSITKMIELYNLVVYIIPYYLYGPDNIPKDWYIYEKWKDRSNHLASELNRCLNENILRLYRSNHNPSEQFRCSCLANLRHCQNMNVMEMVIDDSNNHEAINQIRKAKHGIIDRRILPYTPTQVKYSDRELKQLYEQDMDVLIKNGYVKSIIDKYYEDDNHYCKNTSGINKLVNNDYFWVILAIIIALVIMIPILYFFDSIGGIFGLMIILGIPGYFLSGAWKRK